MSDASYDAPQGEPIEPPTNTDLNWAMLCHLSALLAMPFAVGHIVAPLLIWLLKRDDHPFIDDQGKESLNFQISITIYTAVLMPTLCIAIGVVLIPVLWIVNIVFIVIASLAASRGEPYRYPLTLRLVR